MLSPLARLDTLDGQRAERPGQSTDPLLPSVRVQPGEKQMNIDLFCLGGLLLGSFGAGAVFGASLVVQPPATEYAAEVTNYVNKKRKPEIINWLPGSNQRERMLWRINTTRAFKFTDYTGNQHILSDPQWRRAKQELLAASILEVTGGRTATLSITGESWLENELYGNKQTSPTNDISVGEGGVQDKVDLPADAGWHPIDRRDLYK